MTEHILGSDVHSRWGRKITEGVVAIPRTRRHGTARKPPASCCQHPEFGDVGLSNTVYFIAQFKKKLPYIGRQNDLLVHVF